MPTVSAHVALTLARHIDHVFGVMGNGNAHFLDALERSTDVTYTALRHEAGGVVAADAHFRASGRLAAATATYGAGFTNTLTALAEAVQAHVPLILVVGDEPTSGPRPWDVDQIALASAVGARTYTVGRADAAATTVIAIEHALSYRVPTVLAIPYDVAKLDAGEVPDAAELARVGTCPPRSPRRCSRRHRAELSAPWHPPAALHRPRGAARVAAGARGARGARRRDGGPRTATTALGRGAFRGDFDLGVTGGFGADAMELIGTADVAVVFGAGLNQRSRCASGSFSYPASRAGRHRARGDLLRTWAVSIRGDARLVAEALIDRLAPTGAARESGRAPTRSRPRARKNPARRAASPRRSPRPAFGRGAHRRAARERSRRRATASSSDGGHASAGREHVLAGRLA
ncbi:MAG: thiamine pyrophosphate-binding protein [Microbacterium sp.]